MNWKHGLFIAMWVVAIGAAAVYLNLPPSYPEPPPGWTLWYEPGAVRAVLPEAEGTWCGGFEGLFRLHDDGTATRVDLPGTSGRVIVNALVRDGRGRLWAGHSQGLSVLDGDTWRTWTEDDGLPHDYVAALALSSRGSLWVGTQRGAAEISLGGPGIAVARTLKPDNGLPHSRVSAMIEDDEGGLWVGTYAAPEGGLGRFADGRWTCWDTRDGLPHPNVRALLKTRDGRVWVGCCYYREGGAAVLSPGPDGWAIQRTVPTDELAGPSVRSLCEDRRGRMWLGHEYDGITVRAGGRSVRIVTADDGLPSPEVMTIVEAPDGALWLGTLGGVARLSPEAVEALCHNRAGGPGR